MLSALFSNLEELKTKYSIQGYAVNQTTLEQIFIRMAKDHNSENLNFNEPLSPQSSHMNLKN